MTTADDYRAAVRRGARFTTPTAVVHVRRTGHSHARFGFIVSKKVGTAVVRNRVRRRLKAACYDFSVSVTPGSDVVIRAFPTAAAATFAELKTDVGRALVKASVLDSLVLDSSVLESAVLDSPAPQSPVVDEAAGMRS